MASWRLTEELAGRLSDGDWFLILLVKSAAFTVATCVVILFGLLGTVWWKRRGTLKYMLQFPGKREIVPFFNMWLLHKTCSQLRPKNHYVAHLFNVICGFHFTFRPHGLYSFYIGSTPYLVLYKAEHIEELLASTTLLSKGSQYDHIHTWLGTGLLTSTGQKWKSRRRLLTPAFHFRILEDFVPYLNKHSMTLADVLDKHGRDATSYDIVPKIARCTLDMICETIMGTSVNAQSQKENAYVDAVHRLGEIFMHRVMWPLLRSDFVFALTPSGKEYYRCLRILHSFTRKVIAERKSELLRENVVNEITSPGPNGLAGSGCSKKKPFLDLLLVEHLKGSATMTEEDIREEVDTFMFEGHDTTAMGISWALYLIGHHPDVQEKIHSELDSLFNNDRERYVTTDDLKQMTYLECALKESQRLYPSVPFIARRCTEPFKIDGRTVPIGATIQIAVIFLHKDPKVFPKPEEYRPERFFPENCRGRHPFAYIPFSAGPRNCVGQKFAMMEEKIVVANILRRYKAISIDPRDTMALVPEIVLRAKNGINVKFVRR